MKFLTFVLLAAVAALPAGGARAGGAEGAAKKKASSEKSEPAKSGGEKKASDPKKSEGSENADDPYKGHAKFTAYYVLEVKSVGEGEHTVPVKVKRLDGTVVTKYVSEEDYKIGEMEAAATWVDPQGRRHVYSRMAEGEWEEVEMAHFGLGNKRNPLVPWVHLAGDQKLYPYGSRVYVPAAAGYVAPDGKTLDGYFWVADVGGGIRGPRRFDLFSGSEKDYWSLLKRNHNIKQIEVVIDPIPPAPEGLNPKKTAEVKKILEAQGIKVTVNGKGNMAEKLAVSSALTKYQKTIPQIPPDEYGNPTAAVTLWHLTHCAIEMDEKGAAGK